MRLFSSIVLVLLLAIQLKGASNGQDSLPSENTGVTVSLNAGLCDKYLWRGITYNTGLVFQPEVSLSYKDFSLTSWSNFGITDADDVNYNEIDFTLGYYHSFNSFDIEGSLSYYYYLNQDFTPTIEFNAGIYYPLGDFTLFARSSYDFLACSGAMFGEIGFDYEKELSDKFTVFGTLLTGFGSKIFNEYYITVDKSALNLAGGKVGLTYSPFSNFFIDADFLLNINLDKEIINALGKSSNLIEIIIRKEF